MSDAFILTHAGRAVHCSISPCSRIYSGYGLQIQLAAKPNACNAESVFLHEPTLPVTLEAAAKLGMDWIKSNGIAPLDQLVADWAVRAAQFAAESEAYIKAELAALAKSDAAKKKAGYTHRVDGWIHPRSGDDYAVRAYVGCNPTQAMLNKILRGCTTKRDYKVTAL